MVFHRREIQLNGDGKLFFQFVPHRIISRNFFHVLSSSV